MENTISLKNELIFEYASGKTSLSKSLLASMYLFLNSKETSKYFQFENLLGNHFNEINKIKPDKLKAEECMNDVEISLDAKKQNLISPIDNFINLKSDINWKKIFRGFYEHKFPLSKTEYAKLIKMDPGSSVPLHSHNGKEYILVLEGKFSDEYGVYSKGDLQINNSKIKHTPVACKDQGCVCLTITEDDLVFYGKFAPILNIIVFIKSILFPKK